MSHDWIVCVNGSYSLNRQLFSNSSFHHIPVSYAPRPFPALIFPIAGLLTPREDPYLLYLATIALSRSFDPFSNLSKDSKVVFVGKCMENFR